MTKLFDLSKIKVEFPANDENARDAAKLVLWQARCALRDMLKKIPTTHVCDSCELEQPLDGNEDEDEIETLSPAEAFERGIIDVTRATPKFVVYVHASLGEDSFGCRPFVSLEFYEVESEKLEGIMDLSEASEFSAGDVSELLRAFSAFAEGWEELRKKVTELSLKLVSKGNASTILRQCRRDKMDGYIPSFEFLGESEIKKRYPFEECTVEEAVKKMSSLGTGKLKHFLVNLDNGEKAVIECLKGSELTKGWTLRFYHTADSLYYSDYREVLAARDNWLDLYETAPQLGMTNIAVKGHSLTVADIERAKDAFIDQLNKLDRDKFVGRVTSNGTDTDDFGIKNHA